MASSARNPLRHLFAGLMQFAKVGGALRARPVDGRDLDRARSARSTLPHSTFRSNFRLQLHGSGLALAWIFSSLTGATFAQQAADSSFRPEIARPAFATGKGPTIALDEAHHNFHTTTGRYRPFAELLRRDGYVVVPSKEPFSSTALQNVRVLVIANALHARNGGATADWSLPTPSAFTSDEISALKTWVSAGGALFLIADHMPFPGAAQELLAAFGFTISNGFAQDAAAESRITFSRSNALLADHAIVRGRSSAEKIDAVMSFTGSAFRGPPGATSVLTLPAGSISREPAVAWKFDDKTPSTNVGGWSQGAVMAFDKGRLAIFGEAAMFSAQVSGSKKSPMGMNAPEAKQNVQFLLNLVHWLSGVLE